MKGNDMWSVYFYRSGEWLFDRGYTFDGELESDIAYQQACTVAYHTIQQLEYKPSHVKVVKERK